MTGSVPSGELAATTQVAQGARRSGVVVLLCSLAALDVGLFFWYLKASIIRQPFWDMYSWILHYLDYRAGGGWWAYLWAQHDVHRPVWIRLLTALDVEAFAGVSYPFIVTAAALHLWCAWLLWRETRRGVRGELGIALGCAVLMLTLTSTAAVDAAIPIENGYLHVLAFAVLAIVLLDGAGESRAHTHWRRSAALLAAVAASLASAVGFIIWPILLWSAWRGRVGRTWMLVAAGAALAFASVYLYGMRVSLGAGDAGPDPTITEDMSGRVTYLVTFLGLPWTRSPALAIPGRMLGAALLAVGAWAITRGVRHPPVARLERIALAFILFSLGAAFMASVGRVPASADGVLVPVRYAVLLTPLHVGLLWLAVPLLVRFWSQGAQGPLLASGITAVCIVLLVQQIAVGQAAAARTRAMRTTLDRFSAGQTDPEMTSVIYVDIDQARREWEIIRSAGLYLDTK